MSGDDWYPKEPSREPAPEETPRPAEPPPADDPWAGFPDWPLYGPAAPEQPAAERSTWGEQPPAPERSEPAPPPARSRDPLARLFPGLPHGVRVALDWVLTIAGAVLIVLALKQWVVNPYRIPSSSMEPTLNCARPAQGCLGTSSDRVLACRVCLDFSSPSRGDIVVFNTPKAASIDCGEGGTFVKRVIGLPGETVREDDKGFIWIRGPNTPSPDAWVKLNEPYVSQASRMADSEHFGKTWQVPPRSYFMMGDNRGQSCDSRSWGAVPRHDLIGTVFFVYWPPDRIGFLGAIFALLALPFLVGRRPTFS